MLTNSLFSLSTSRLQVFLKWSWLKRHLFLIHFIISFSVWWLFLKQKSYDWIVVKALLWRPTYDDSLSSNPYLLQLSSLFHLPGGM
jgi:hypothetical protein